MGHYKHISFFWGLRHFDMSRKNQDPSLRSGPGNEDEQAIGLTFECTPDIEKIAKITYLSANPEIHRWVELNLFSEWEPDKKALQLRYRDIGRNAIVVSSTLDHSDPVSYFFFVLMGRLGHAISL
jgi:hypothetical protein